MRLTDLTCWQVKNRIDLLNAFHGQVETYFSTALFTGSDEPIENEQSATARTKINKMIHLVMRYVYEAGISSDVNIINVNVPRTFDTLENIFNLDLVPSSKVTDTIERAIGVYELD